MRTLIAMGLVLILGACASHPLPDDCTGKNARTEECRSMMQMALYADQAEKVGQEGQFLKAAALYGQAAEVAVRFSPELIVSYRLDQARMLRSQAGEDGQIAHLKKAVSILFGVGEHLTDDLDDALKIDFYATTGQVTFLLSRLEKDEQWSRNAVDSYEFALKLSKKEEDPRFWVTAHHNLGISYSELYNRTGDSGFLISGRIALSEALQGLDPVTQTADWVNTSLALADNTATYGQLTGDEAMIQDALNRYGRLIDLLQDKEEPNLLGNGHHNLALLLYNLGVQLEKDDYLIQAHGNFNIALDAYSEAGNLVSWVETQIAQAKTVLKGAELIKSEDRYKHSLRLYQNALDYIDRDMTPMIWAKAAQGLGDAYVSYAQSQNNTEMISQGVAQYEQAIKVYAAHGFEATVKDLRYKIMTLREKQ